MIWNNLYSWKYECKKAWTSFQNLFLSYIFADTVNMLTWSWLFHRGLSFLWRSMCVCVHTPKEYRVQLQTVQNCTTNSTLPVWKRNVCLDNTVCIEELSETKTKTKQIGPTFKKWLQKNTLENCHYTVCFKVSHSPQTEQWYILASSFTWKSPKWSFFITLTRTTLIHCKKHFSAFHIHTHKKTANFYYPYIKDRNVISMFSYKN